MSLRRNAAVLAAGTLLCTVVTPLAYASTSASTTVASSDTGLYGEHDPQYDGVWRQSLALLAQDAAGVRPADEATEWLVGQQCADGSFAAYRDTTKQDGCGEKTVRDSNATGAAVQALAALGGHSDAVTKAVDWLRSVQNDDGGWGYNPGSPSDANSTSVAVGALAATDENPAKVHSDKGDHSPYDALRGLQLDCSAKPEERGAFAYQPDKRGELVANADATAAATLAGHGEGLVVEPVEKDDTAAPEPLSCGDGKDGGTGQNREPQDSAEAGAAQLARTLEKNDQHLPSVAPDAKKGEADYANTADAVLALAAGEHGDQARTTLAWLEKHARDWDKFKADPAALGGLVLASRAAGGDPRDFGGTNLVKRLNATGPKPAEITDTKTESTEEDDDSSTVVTASLVVAGLAAGAGVGFLLSGRRKGQNP
ncbi:prenyltransferase/squalene oxidase repeat-containing protein [Streptomyces oceani]|uniref:Prenyltransferase alpha-alpha toroid domain-containing protein n=1 Tax=Streptomyces oceani TaxID=1075402 RepID=A0A1E7KF56_9ACTN|nr:prenyltransferase/squalene oxidase repeat-containing protein [Streptomyces oceani]OEV02535.1 hypothetical protein AN216_16015 [Streptomyces oceani]